MNCGHIICDGQDERCLMAPVPANAHDKLGELIRRAIETAREEGYQSARFIYGSEHPWGSLTDSDGDATRGRVRHAHHAAEQAALVMWAAFYADDAEEVAS